MSNILIINAKKQFGHSNGELNQTLSDVAESFLRDLQHEVQVTVVDDGYDIEAEVQKYLWADAVIYQMPGWWMGEPWILKKYIDEVFTAGHGSLYASDGRTRSDAAKKYGSGGLIQGKKIPAEPDLERPARSLHRSEPVLPRRRRRRRLPALPQGQPVPGDGSLADLYLQ